MAKAQWQKHLEQFNKSNSTEPLFLTTDLDHTDAQILLEQNEHNRNLIERVVVRYSEFMKKGKWLLNGECIKIDPDGLLLDGQHRLEAIRRNNGTPVRVSMAIGVDKNTFSVNDTGKSRTSGDILQMAGYKNVSANAASLRYLLWYQDHEGFGSYPDLAPSNILEAIERWPHIQHFASPSYGYHIFCPSSFVQFFMYVTQSINPEASYEFFNKFETGEQLTKTNPILHLRKMLISYRSKKLRLDKRHLAAAFIITWNAFIEKTRVDTVKWDGKQFPVITGIDRKKLFSKNSGFGKSTKS